MNADLVSRRIAALTPTLRALASAPAGSHYATFVIVDGRAELTHWDARQVDPRDPWTRDLERAVAHLRLPRAAQPLTVTVELEL